MNKEHLISTETGSFGGYGDNEAIIKLLKKVGFEAYDFSMIENSDDRDIFIDKPDYKTRAEELKKLSQRLGIVCNQTHAPFPTAIVGDEAYNEKALIKVKRAIEVSEILGAKICVVHPCNDRTARENAVYYESLAECAKNSGVMVALENMWNWNEEKDEAVSAACSDHVDFKKHLDLLDENVFGACLDLGHAEMRGLNTSCESMIKTLGGRLKALHIHDNDLHYDEHSLPFTRDMDFDKITAALKEIGYDGDVTFEAIGYIRKTPDELKEAAAGYMLQVGKYLRNKIF